MKTCTICGKKLTQEQKRFCSIACRSKGREKRVKRICETCGKEFEVIAWQLNRDNFKGKYCSQVCHYAGKKGVPLLKNRRREIHYCVVCGKEFETGGRAGDLSKLFCSGECRRAGRYRKGTEAKKISAIDAAYIAGFIDGEGSIMIYLRSGVVSTKLNASNTKRVVLDWICETLGVGRVSTFEHKNGKYSTSHFWICTGDSALTVLEQIRPYLKIKQAQADLAIETQKRLKIPHLKADRTWQREAFEQMKTLNRRGPQAVTQED